MEPMPASSKMDPLLAKAKSISNGGSASKRTSLRRWGKKNICATTAAGERSENMWEQQPWRDPGPCRRAGGAPGTRAEIPQQPMLKTTVRQAVPSAHGGSQWSRSPPAARGGPHAGAGGYPKEAVTHGQPTLEQICWSSLLLKDCIPWERPTLEQGQSVSTLPLRKKEPQRQYVINWQQPHPSPPVLLAGEGEKIRSEVKPGKKGEVGGRCVYDLVLFLIIPLWFDRY